MLLTFTPVRSDDRLEIARSGDALELNGRTFDFAPLPAGAVLPQASIACDWIAGDVSRDAAGRLTVPLVLPHGANAPEAARFPAPVDDPPDGPVTLPETHPAEGAA